MGNLFLFFIFISAFSVPSAPLFPAEFSSAMSITTPGGMIVPAHIFSDYTHSMKRLDTKFPDHSVEQLWRCDQNPMMIYQLTTQGQKSVCKKLISRVNPIYPSYIIQESGVKYGGTKYINGNTCDLWVGITDPVSFTFDYYDSNQTIAGIHLPIEIAYTSPFKGVKWDFLDFKPGHINKFIFDIPKECLESDVREDEIIGQPLSVLGVHYRYI